MTQTIQETQANINKMAFQYEIISNLNGVMPVALFLFAAGMLFSYWRWRICTYICGVVGFFLFAVFGGFYPPLMRAALAGLVICVGGIVWELYSFTKRGFAKKN